MIHYVASLIPAMMEWNILRIGVHSKFWPLYAFRIEYCHPHSKSGRESIVVNLCMHVASKNTTSYINPKSESFLLCPFSASFILRRVKSLTTSSGSAFNFIWVIYIKYTCNLTNLYQHKKFLYLETFFSVCLNSWSITFKI